MKTSTRVVILTLSLAATPVFAESSFIVANNLGSLLASEKYCGLTYKPEAIAAYIEKNVKADDMGFSGMLSLMTDGASLGFEEFSETRKVAHCTQSRRVAKANSFID